MKDASYACHTFSLFTLDACHGTAVIVWAEVGAEISLHSCSCESCTSSKPCTVSVSYESQCEQRKLTKAL